MGRDSTARSSTPSCVDELDLTVSPVLVGGDGPRVIVGGAADAWQRFELVHLGVDDESFLYGRWTRRRT